MTQQSPSFPQFFLEQEFDELFLLTAGVAATFLIVLALMAWVANVRFGFGAARTFVVGSAITLAVFVVGFTVFEAAALYLRTEPFGSGVQRDGREREHFVAVAKSAFAVLYVAVLVVGAATSYLLARRRTPERAARTALIVAVAILVFLTITFPFAEFINACEVGESFLLESSC
jgi:hypothetical protein